MLTGNKGEWSEFYVFLKLLADGKIFAADQNLNKNANLFYLILKIIRGKVEDLEYVRKERIIIQRTTGEVLSEIPIKNIIKYAKLFYEGISKGNKGERTFELGFAKQIMEELRATSLSGGRQETSDIRIVIHDPKTQLEPILGFSIKSYIGGKPTLFNASKQSNIIYKISPILESTQIKQINELKTHGNRRKWLTDNGFKLSFVKMNSETFRSNLELIDSRLPEIISHLILYKSLDGTNKLSDITKLLNSRNPCNFNIDLNPNFYTYKIKRFLVDAALGMTSGKLWTGTFNVTGGYIAVKKDGELLCYHIYNWNDFQNYLLNNTKIDFPDSGPDRCDYGKVLSGDELKLDKGSYIKINFQIRFT